MLLQAHTEWPSDVLFPGPTLGMRIKSLIFMYAGQRELLSSISIHQEEVCLKTAAEL